MSTKMTEKDWAAALDVFRASLPRRGDKGRDDRLFLEAMHYFSVHNISWRALPDRFGKWNSVWKRFDRLSKAGVFETFFEHLSALSSSAHLIQMFDSTVVRALVSAAGAKGCRMVRRWAARAAAFPPKFVWLTMAGQSLIDRFDAEGCVHRDRQPPRQDLPAEPVDDGAEIDEPSRHRHIRYVHCPDLVGPCDR